MSKYGNKKVIKSIGDNTVIFDSIAEYDRYFLLRNLERAGKIKNLECQPEFELQAGFVRNGKKIRAIKYKGDFRYTINNIITIEDVKGVKTQVFEVKLKMLLQKYQDIKFILVQRTKNGYFQETEL